MTTAGTEITKTNIVEQMKGIRDAYNGGIVWHNANNPFRDYLLNSQYGYGSDLTTTALGTDPNIVASIIVDQFKALATSLSQIRNTRLIKYYNTNGNNGVTYDQTQMTNWPDRGVGANIAAVPSYVTAGNVISAPNIDSFVAGLSAEINANRTSTVTIQEFYCHSSCHSSCHGSI